MGKKASIGELMGTGGAAATSSGRKISLEDLPHILGEKMPKIEYNPIGRFRLATALRNRFGDGYKNLPGISDLMQQFDNEASFNVKLQHMNMIKPRGK